jgi:hypothetical protein
VIGGGVVIAFLWFTQPDNTPATATSKPGAKKTSPTDLTYLPIDFAHNEKPYPALKLALVDAFRPDISRGTADAADAAGPGWTYSGMAVVDGVGQGVMVNTTTDESVILHRGEKWQSFKVADITADQVVFNGPNGPQTLRVDTKESEKPAPNSAAVSPLPMPSAPMQMPLTGDIGSGDQSLSIVQDNSGYGGGRGRRGRGRGRNAGN